MTKVMICGSRDEADIDLLVEAGVDAIGLITEVRQPLPCNLSRTKAKKLAARVPPLISAVLILTEERVDEICRLVEYICPDAVQLHGFNRPEDVALLREKLPVKIIKTLHFQGERLVGGSGAERLALDFLRAGADAILLDSFHEGKVGSTGRAVDYRIARRLSDAVRPRPLILAGGLNSDNVVEAIQRVKPFAVDVFTGVTTEGRLDLQKVNRFIRSVRSNLQCEAILRKGDEKFAG